MMLDSLFKLGMTLEKYANYTMHMDLFCLCCFHFPE